MYIFSYPSVLTYVLGAKKKHLIEMVLLNNHYICFGGEIRKLNFRYALLTKSWDSYMIDHEWVLFSESSVQNLFVLILYVPVNNFSVIMRQVLWVLSSE